MTATYKSGSGLSAFEGLVCSPSTEGGKRLSVGGRETRGSTIFVNNSFTTTHVGSTMKSMKPET